MHVSLKEQVKACNYHVAHYPSGLQRLYLDQEVKPVHHAALRLRDILALFGPVHSRCASGSQWVCTGKSPLLLWNVSINFVIQAAGIQYGFRVYTNNRPWIQSAQVPDCPKRWNTWCGSQVEWNLCWWSHYDVLCLLKMIEVVSKSVGHG